MYAKEPISLWSIAVFVFLLVLPLKVSTLAPAPGQIKTLNAQLDNRSPKKYRYWFEEDAKPMSFLRAMDLLENSTSFRLQTIAALKEAGLKNIYWECPPVNQSTIAAHDFEFVIVEALSLQSVKTADATPFGAQLTSCKGEVMSFENLGKDATLVVPCIRSSLTSYPHLGRFLKEAPLEQQHELLKMVSHTLLEKISKTQNPIWLSTSGIGVHFLHVRLDTKPKYYSYQPFFKWPLPK